MKITEDKANLSIRVEMTRDEVEEGLLMSIMKNSNQVFLPYRITDLPEKMELNLEYISRGTKCL